MKEKDPLLAQNQPETASEKLFSGINGLFLGFSAENVGSPPAVGSWFGEGVVFPERNLRDQRDTWKFPVFTLSSKTRSNPFLTPSF